MGAAGMVVQPDCGRPHQIVSGVMKRITSSKLRIKDRRCGRDFKAKIRWLRPWLIHGTAIAQSKREDLRRTRSSSMIHFESHRICSPWR
jgi:hypothetical protein